MAKKNFVSTLDLGGLLASGGSIPVAKDDGATPAETLAASALGVKLVDLARTRPLSRTWRAESTADGTPVAIVVVADSATDDERERFARMARDIHAAGDALPGVLRARAVAETRDAFLTDLWTTGSARDLSALNWSLRRRVEFWLRTVRTLHAIHARGLVHGCLCPANVLLDDDLAPVVAETGTVAVHELRKRGGDAAPYVPFAPPEVIKGGEVDARSDVYAVGRMLEDMTKGEGIPAALHRVLARCTMHDPSARYASAAELAEALEEIITLLPDAPSSPPPAAPVSGRPSARVSSPAPERGRRSLAPAKPTRSSKPAAPVASWMVPRWLGVVGLVAMAAALGASVAVGGSNEVVRAGLAVGLLAGAALASTLMRFGMDFRRGAAVAMQLGFAAACATIVLSLDPLSRGYRLAALQRLHADPASRRAAVVELLRLGGDFRGVSLADVDLYGLGTNGSACDAETKLPARWRCREGRVERTPPAPAPAGAPPAPAPT